MVPVLTLFRSFLVILYLSEGVWSYAKCRLVDQSALGTPNNIFPGGGSGTNGTTPNGNGTHTGNFSYGIDPVRGVNL